MRKLPRKDNCLPHVASHEPQIPYELDFVWHAPEHGRWPTKPRLQDRATLIRNRALDRETLNMPTDNLP